MPADDLVLLCHPCFLSVLTDIIYAETTMKFLTTFFLPLLPLTLGIQVAAAAEQIIFPGVPMDVDQPTSNTGRPTLFDLLTIEPSSSIFFSYARELQLSRLFVEVGANLTVLVPTNKAVMALARKP